MNFVIGEVKDERFQAFSNRMNEYIEQKKLPCIITALFQDGKLINCEKFGKANIEKDIPIEFDGIFRIASMSKPIVSVAALMLYEEGHFSLDDPISKFIPKAKNLTVFKSENEGEVLTEKLEREVTMRDIFTHTGGFTYFWDINHPYDQKFKYIMDKAGEKTLAEVIPLIF